MSAADRLFWPGLAALAAGLWFWLRTTADAAACTDPFVRLADEAACSSADRWHAVGGVAALSGIALIVTSIITGPGIRA